MTFYRRHRDPYLVGLIVSSLLMAAACSHQEADPVLRATEGEVIPDSSTRRAPDADIAFPEAWPPSFGIGRTARAEEIVAWDIDVMPDGTGLPPGSGTVAEGASLYAVQCAVCHGATGTEGPNDRLVGRNTEDDFAFARNRRLHKTIGSYWPYATTLYDYIYRAMPQTAPGSLTPDELYSLVAYLLYRNDIVAEDAVMDAATLPAIIMPARDHFVRDNRQGGPEIR